MKIKGTCKRCDREFLADQVIENGGRCPWDGQPFSADYAIVLIDALRSAQDSGTTLENAMEAVADIHPEFTLDGASVVGKITTQITRLQENLIRQG